jgi:hypothetical protein
MYPKKVGNILLKFFLDELEKDIAAHIAKALRQDFQNIKSTAKALALQVEVKMETIKKWYSGSNPPSTAHLIVLARTSPSVRQALLQLMDNKPGV